MKWQCPARISPSVLRACAATLLFASGACKPSVFSSNPQTQNAGADAGSEPAAAQTNSTVPEAGKAGQSGSDAQSVGRGGTSAASTAGAAKPTGGKPAGGGTSGRASAAGSGGRTPAAGSGGQAAQGGAGGSAAVTCPPADLSAVRLDKLTDAVLSVPDPKLEISTGPALRVAERMLMLVGTQSDGPLQGRSAAAWADLSSLSSATPKLSSVTGALLPDEPIENYLSTQPSSVWLSQDAQSAQFLFTRYYIVAPLSAGLARSQLSQPAPAQIQVPVEMLFKPKLAADGGMMDAYRPATLTGGLRMGELLYFYVCNPPPNAPADMSPRAPCRVARVLSTQVQDGGRYEFWSEGQWVPELERATPVLAGAGAFLSVYPNAYLHKLLAVYSGANNDVRLAWAEAPEGPFHELADAVPTVPGTGGAIPLSHGAAELPLPHADCDPEIAVWYSVPVEQPVDNAEPRVRRETHVMRLGFH